jgi:CheY-like chemotaxis protein
LRWDQIIDLAKAGLGNLVFLFLSLLSFTPTILNRPKMLIKSIFLADDNRQDCLSFEKAVVNIDPHIKLVTVTNGEELLQLLTHYIPELLFLDLEMPAKNGIQCLQAIRSNRVYDHLPIIVFTATQRANNIQVAYGLGANLFFSKPKELGALVPSLHYILQMDWTDPSSITSRYFNNNQYQPFRLAPYS